MTPKTTREYKFRAWDTQNNRWFQEGDIAICSNGNILKFDDDGEYTHLGKDLYRLCFSTGLKDKNGKQIYEGDILKFVEGKDRFYTIEWQNEEVQFQAWMTAQHSSTFKPEIRLPMYTGYWNQGEIVGNIWEHAHLLNQ